MSKIMIAAAILMLAASAPAGAAAEEAGTKGPPAPSPSELLPASSGIEGWERDGEMLYYEPENLWEYINGSAENFLTYDFQDVAAQHYLDESGREIKVEVYRHSSPLMAFGIYTQFRTPDGDYTDIGNEAFGDGYSLHFWKGRYYVKVYSFDEGEESEAAMRSFARYVEERISEAGSPPAEIALFPAGGLIEKSVKYLPAGVLGSSDLPPALAAEYSSENGSGKLYIISMDSSEAAGGLLKRYAAGLGVEVAEARAGDAVFMKGSGEVQYRGRLLLFQFGRWVGIITGFKDAPSGSEDLCLRAVEGMSRAGG